LRRAILLMITLFVLILNSCGYRETFIVTGEIEQIDKVNKLIFIKDKGPIKVNTISEYQVGQMLEVTLIDTTGEDCWCPDDFKVKKIELLD
jgi:hypothetical protein